jgi:hypothetical protein
MRRAAEHGTGLRRAGISSREDSERQRQQRKSEAKSLEALGESHHRTFV